MTRSAALRTALAVLLAAAAAGSARGVDPAPVSFAEIQVTTENGEPVADAVVLLRPVEGAAPAVAPGRVEMGQHDLTFDPHVLVATVGSDVAFPNRDQVRHHVYSFSDAKTFELRLYGGEVEHVVHFDRPGVVPLGCNIHDDMIAFIYVADTPWAARTDAQGRVHIESVPPGDYSLAVWHELLRGDGEVVHPLTIAAPDVSETVTVDLRRPRRRDSAY
jgi:plastocyanin